MVYIETISTTPHNRQELNSADEVTTYNLKDFQVWIETIPIDERKEIRNRYINTEIQRYIKYSVGYVNYKLELRFKRDYDIPIDIVIYLTNKSPSFIIGLKKQWCERNIDSLYHLIEKYSQEKEKFIFKFPIFKESLEIVYSETIKKIKKSIEYYKRYIINLEGNYIQPKNKFSSEDIENAAEKDLSFLFSNPRKIPGGWKVLCCFHKEKTPSMILRKGFHCFGCNKHGSSIDLYMFLNNCNFLTALEELLKM